MAVQVRELDIATERERFIKLQWRFLGQDPNWAPPLLMDRRKLLDTKKNPFYRHAEIALFIAEKDGQPAGRIAAITNANHNAVHRDKVGFFGFFDCADDQEVANALFDAAAAWLKARGMDTMRGPMNPSINDEIGMLVKGFDSPPLVLMTYNPPYYAALCDGYGFVKEKDLLAYAIHNETTVSPKLERVQKAVRERYKVTLRDVDFSKLEKEIVILRDLYNRSWEDNWGAVAMTDAEFDFLAADLKQVLGSHKDFASFLLRDGVPIGFSLTLPDINELLISNRRGWMLPGVFKLLTGMKKVKKSRILVLGVLPEHRDKGFDAIMYYEIWSRAAKHGIFFGEASWILEDNVMMNRAAKLMNADPYKTYRIYDKAI